MDCEPSHAAEATISTQTLKVRTAIRLNRGTSGTVLRVESARRGRAAADTGVGRFAKGVRSS